MFFLAIAAMLFLADPVYGQIARPDAASASDADARVGRGLVGERIRVSVASRTPGTPLDDAPVIGRLLRSTGDTLVMEQEGGGGSATIVANPTLKFERWHRPASVKGWIIGGALLDAVAGGSTANVLNDPPKPRDASGECLANNPASILLACPLALAITDATYEAADQAGAVALGIVVGASVGAIVGRLIGRSRAGGGWKPVERVALSATPKAGHGFQLGVTLKR